MKASATIVIITLVAIMMAAFVTPPVFADPLKKNNLRSTKSLNITDNNFVLKEAETQPQEHEVGDGENSVELIPLDGSDNEMMPGIDLEILDKAKAAGRQLDANGDSLMTKCIDGIVSSGYTKKQAIKSCEEALAPITDP